MQSTRTTASLLVLALLASCGSSARWRADEALAADKLELLVDERGRPVEYEYHIDPSAVPANIHAAMDALHPGGAAVGAEKEYQGGQLYWEISKEIDGLEVEAMFLPDGTLHSAEIEVRASAVPAAVAETMAAFGGEVDKWEEIRDGEGALVEYHVKAKRDGRAYKVVVSVAGERLSVVRELVAEIEVPVSDD